MINIPIKNQIKFLDGQVREYEDMFRGYLNTPMNQHFKNRSAFKAVIWGVDEKRGTLILQFEKGFIPRLNFSFAGFAFSGVSDPLNPASWNFNYRHFRETHTKASTTLTTVFYLKSSDVKHRFIGCRDFDADFFDQVKLRLSKGEKPSIILAESDPPTDYLLNLKDFINAFPEDTVLSMPVSKSIEDWEPELLQSAASKKEVILQKLNSTGEVIIQGPPGTGKSHLIAEIVDDYLSRGKSVCVTALTNKALLEVAEKPGILSWLGKHKVFKTNLKHDERKKLSQLRKAENLFLDKGELLLASYYKLSGWFNTRVAPDQQLIINQHYDLLVIEEASQTFLATIAAFKKLGRAILIVGDPYQLPPIVINENEALQIDLNIGKFTKGLETYAANAGKDSYILTESYRLSAGAAALTGLFYKGLLTSAHTTHRPLIVSPVFRGYLPEKGDTKLVHVPLIACGDRPQKAIDFIMDLVVDILSKNPDAQVAVLSPFRKTVVVLQDQLSERVDDFSNLTVETIDRIQGLTVDFSIYLLTLKNPTFALNLNRFNVATSRAKSGTIIITDEQHTLFVGVSPLVKAYLNSLETVSIDHRFIP